MRWFATGNPWWRNRRVEIAVVPKAAWHSRRGGVIQDRDNGRQPAEEKLQHLTVKAAFFCSDNGMVASTYRGWL